VSGQVLERLGGGLGADLAKALAGLERQLEGGALEMLDEDLQVVGSMRACSTGERSRKPSSAATY